MSDQSADKSFDVIVVGGGVAGVACARHLLERGRRVLLLEARDRLGGRIHSLDSLRPAVEYGAEFVHGAPREEIFRHFEAVVDVCDTHVHLAGRKPNILPDFWQSLKELTRRLNPKRGIDRSIKEFMDAQGKGFDALTRARFLSYAEGFYAADLNVLGEKGLALAEQDETPAWNGVELFRPLPSYGHLISGLVGRDLFKPDAIRLSTAVTRVEMQDTRAVVHALSPAGAQVFTADSVVLTVPLSLLLAGQPELAPYPAELAQAISGLRMGCVERITFEFESRFWENVVNKPIGFMHAGRDDYFPTWWTQMPMRTNRLIAWQGGPKAEEMASWTEADKVEAALETLARLTARDENLVREHVRTWYLHNWSTDPFSLGAYSYAALDGEDIARRLTLPFGDRLYVAGEATAAGSARGTVHGAFESGLRAATQILGRAAAAQMRSLPQADLANF